MNGLPDGWHDRIFGKKEKPMAKNMYALPEHMCYICIKEGKLMVCDMVKDGNGYTHPKKNGYKPDWKPNRDTSKAFLAAVEKITGKKF